MTKEEASRRERRIVARRRHILDTATRIFAENGFHRATMKDIADAADIAVGTLYNYFDSKEDLLMDLIDEFSERGQRRPHAVEALEYDYREAFHFGLRERIRQIDVEYMTMHLAVLPEILSVPELRQRYYEHIIQPSVEVGEQHVQARVELGHIDPMEDIPLTVRLMHSLWLGISILLLLGDAELQTAWQDPNRISKAIAAFYFDAVKINRDAQVEHLTPMQLSGADDL